MPYTTLQQSFDAGTPDGERYYYKSQYLNALSDEIIEMIVDQVEPLLGDFTVVGFEQMGDAIAGVDPTATAFPHRIAAFNFSVWAGWSNTDDDNALITWARQFRHAMTPFACGGVYSTYLDRDDEPRVRNAYGENYDRLIAVRKSWNPDHVCHTLQENPSQKMEFISTSGTTI